MLFCRSGVGLAALALLVAAAAATQVPSGAYCGNTPNGAATIRFDFEAPDLAPQLLNCTVVDFGKPFPTCTYEPYVVTPTEIRFPQFHAAPTTDCMAVLFQELWITNFTAYWDAPRRRIDFVAGAFAIHFTPCQ